MRTVTLGNDTIPGMAVGTWSWGTGFNGGNKVFGHSYGIDELKPVYNACIENGLNLFDTAAVYGMGASEDIIGHFIKGHDSTIISTKFTPFGIQPKNAMKNTLTKSLKRLNREQADIYWIHNPLNVDKWTKQAAQLYLEGRINHIGVSNHHLHQIQRASDILEAQGLHLDAVQNHYSLLYRLPEHEGVLQWCQSNGVRFFAYMILEQGALTGEYSAERHFEHGTKRAKAYPVNKLRMIEPLLTTMRQIAVKYHTGVSQIAVAWAIAKGVVPIIGCTNTKHVEALVSVDKINIDQYDLDKLERAAGRICVNVKARWE